MSRKPPPPGPGRPKGMKNKFPTALKDKVLHACAHLESQGKDLSTIAANKPEWFWETFIKPMLPKELALSGKDGKPLCVIIKDLRQSGQTD
jgi:hypothetical protein